MGPTVLLGIEYDDRVKGATVDEPTDRLISEASQGDEAALDGLLRRYLPGLRRYVNRHAPAPVRARDSAADLVQSACRELLLRLKDGRFEYQGEAQFKQWLYQAAMNKISDRRKYHAAERRGAGRSPIEAADPESGGSPLDAFLMSMSTPSRQLERDENMRRLQAAFDQLDEREQRIIRMARVEGRTHQEIAGVFGVTPENSRVLLSRALARLADLALK